MKIIPVHFSAYLHSFCLPNCQFFQEGQIIACQKAWNWASDSLKAITESENILQCLYIFLWQLVTGNFAAAQVWRCYGDWIRKLFRGSINFTWLDAWLRKKALVLSLRQYWFHIQRAEFYNHIYHFIPLLSFPFVTCR